MYFWSDFRAEEVREDFARFARDGFNHLRVNLDWERFQPGTGDPDPDALRNLAVFLRIAEEQGLKLTLALFMGHMSGANFLPPWLIAKKRRGRKSDPRYPIVCGGKVLRPRPILDFWADAAVLKLQSALVESVLKTAGRSPALYALDFGNELDNVLPPAKTEDATLWFRALRRLAKKIRPRVKVTLGFHGETLFQAKRLSIFEIAPHCDFVSFHPYPNYTDWIDDPLDTDFFPFVIRFLHRLTGKPVFLQEFGLPVPTRQKKKIRRIVIRRFPRSPARETQRLFSRRAYKAFLESALEKSRLPENLGMLLWCAHDYGPRLWKTTPLDSALHERHFGFYDKDGKRKLRSWNRGAGPKTRRRPKSAVFDELISLYRDQAALEAIPAAQRSALWRAAFRRFKTA